MKGGDKTVTCSKCNKEVKNPTYLVRQLGYLCGECSREYADKKIKILQEKIDDLYREIEDMNNKVNKNIQKNCEHDFVDTGYGCVNSEETKVLMRCIKCNFTKYIKF